MHANREGDGLGHHADGPGDRFLDLKASRVDVGPPAEGDGYIDLDLPIPVKDGADGRGELDESPAPPLDAYAMEAIGGRGRDVLEGFPGDPDLPISPWV